MENTGGDASWLNVINEQHNKSMHNMVRSGIIDSNQHGKIGVVQYNHQLNYMDAKLTVH